MPRSSFRMIALTFVLCTSGACSQDHDASPPATSAGTKSVASSAPAYSAASDDDTLHDCAKLFTPNDAAGIFTVPVTVSDYGPAGGMCSFGTPKGASITLIRTSDPSAEMQWKEKKSNPSFVSLAGVGDEALRVKNASIIVSKKGNVYCSAQLFGYDSARAQDDIAKQSGDERAKAIGALCNKAFAAH